MTSFFDLLLCQWVFCSFVSSLFPPAHPYGLLFWMADNEIWDPHFIPKTVRTKVKEDVKVCLLPRANYVGK